MPDNQVLEVPVSYNTSCRRGLKTFEINTKIEKEIRFVVHGVRSSTGSCRGTRDVRGRLHLVSDMAAFLSQAGVVIRCPSGRHAVSAAMYLRRDTLSCMALRTEIVLTDFITHIIASTPLKTSPIPCDYATKAPKSVQKLCSVISESSSGPRVTPVSFSPPGHWACLIIDCQAGLIG